MIEYWDIYDKNKVKTGKIIERGKKLCKDEYHLVINAWIRNDKNEFLISQRSANKTHPLMWECTGGSAIMGEDSVSAAIREIREELGIKVCKKHAKLIGSVQRYYPDCPDILDAWLFTSNITIDKIKIQKEEINNVMWASVEKIKELYEKKKFEANAYFDDVLKHLNNQVFYIGLNANNAICNENFFSGSITLYPTKEKGNVFYSQKTINDTNSNDFYEKYCKFIYKSVSKIKNNNVNSTFICFNQKIMKLCQTLDDVRIIGNKKTSRLVPFLNNKFITRDFVKKYVPILDYFIINGEDINYDYITKIVGSKQFVIQSETGSGGNNTYYISSKNDLKRIEERNCKYCVSKYIKHLPLNITLIIGKNSTILLPLSVQLILLTDNKFKYIGGDFDFIEQINKSIINKIKVYSLKIANELKIKGYRGILGIDYILYEKNKNAFMEINPRLQSSSFLISIELQRECNMCLAELHYRAIANKSIKQPNLKKINKSFVNCNIEMCFPKLSNYEVICNGYFKGNKTSCYRKVFNYSILKEDKFEKTNI